MSEQTYWNGEPLETPARRVLVRVGAVDTPSWWCNGLEGTERRAVEVKYGEHTFLIDDDDGEGNPVLSDQQQAMMDELQKSHPEIWEAQERNKSKGRGQGWLKVTAGRGAPFGPNSFFRSLPPTSEVLRELTVDDFA